jgi:RNA polymerase sigma-70 factor (ECF subfamily)
MSDSWPDTDEIDRLFRCLCNGDPLALTDFITAVLDPLANHLRRWRSGADDHLYITVAEDAVLALVRKPAIYDPAKRGLIGFLCMSAQGDLLNALRKEQKHHTNRESHECVELAPDHGNTSAAELADELPSFDDPHVATEIASFTPTERAAFELMRAGERATAAFAAVLGIGHLSEDEQRREVKRVKDRIIVRLKRAGRNA